MRRILAASVIALATAQPEQISVNFGGDGVSTSLSFSWAVPGSSNPAGVVHWGYARALGNSTSADVRHYSVAAYESPALYNATVSELIPGSTVYYSVGDSRGFSAVMTVGVPLARGAFGTRIALLGDLGTTANSNVTIDDILVAHGQASFDAALLAGDLSYADGQQPVWDTFGNLAQPLTSAIPTSFVVGNHEWFDSSDYSFLAYLSRVHGPAAGGGASSGGGGLYYSIDIGAVHIVAIAGYCPEMSSTSTQPCLAPGSPQRAWLEADLAAVDRTVTPWVVAVFHEPYMNSNTAHSIAKEGLPMQKAVEDVLYKAGVDMVFSGHVHAYERSCKAYKYECLTDGTGPVYVTIGDGGNREGLAKTWVTPQPAWSLFRQASFGHGELTAVNATHMHWRWVQNSALRPGGPLEAGLDEVWVVKGEPGEVGGPGGSAQSPEPVLR